MRAMSKKSCLLDVARSKVNSNHSHFLFLLRFYNIYEWLPVISSLKYTQKKMIDVLK